MEEETRVARAASEVGCVNGTVGDGSGHDTSVIAEVIQGIALSASGGGGVESALEDTIGERDTTNAIG